MQNGGKNSTCKMVAKTLHARWWPKLFMQDGGQNSTCKMVAKTLIARWWPKSDFGFLSFNYFFVLKTVFVVYQSYVLCGVVMGTC